MTSPLIPSEIGCTEVDELTIEAEEQLYCCPRCEKRFLAYVEVVNGDTDQMPVVELILCTQCEESFDAANLYLLWLDWNNYEDTIH
jgi:hypothetical protein